MAGSHLIMISNLQQQERSPSALTGQSTYCSLIGLLKALHNLRMGLNLTLLK